MSDGAHDPAALAREHLLTAHGKTLHAVLDAADAVATGEPEGADEAADGSAVEADEDSEPGAAGWLRLDDGRLATADRDAVVPVLRAVLDHRGILGELPALLAAAVDAAGFELPAAPVAAPPYVAVTSTGPVLRGTVDDGRLVVRIDCFDVVRGVEGAGENGVVYARTATEPAGALSVSFAPSK